MKGWKLIRQSERLILQLIFPLLRDCGNSPRGPGASLFFQQFSSSSSRVLQTLAGCNYNLSDLPLIQRGAARVDERKHLYACMIFLCLAPQRNAPNLATVVGLTLGWVLCGHLCFLFTPNKHKLVTIPLAYGRFLKTAANCP